MNNMMRFSIFGEYEPFATSNVDKYMALIQFFSSKGFKPMTANELKLSANGQAQVFVMPTFLKDSNALVEITTTRINFTLQSPAIEQETNIKQKIFDLFYGEMKELMIDFTTKFDISSNRVAINCNILLPRQDDCVLSEIRIPDAVQTESRLRQCYRMTINNEDCNFIIEKYNAYIPMCITQHSYDVNTAGENATLRFKGESFIQMLDSMKEKVLSIKGDS